jgi:anti-sigma-K factor RskA
MSELDDSGGLDGDDALVAEFVLGLLDRAEFEAFKRRLAAEPALRRAVVEWRVRFEGLDIGFPETPAPASAWSRLESRLFGAGASATGGWWNSVSLWRGFTAAALAAVVVAVGFNVFRPAPLGPEEFAVQLVAALQSQEGSGVEFVAFYDTASGAVKLLGLSGQSVPDKDYELWYIRGDEPAVSMGVIPVDQRKEIPLDAAARQKIAEGTVLAVTLEQKGGSPTGVAQGPIVALGKALPI